MSEIPPKPARASGLSTLLYDSATGEIYTSSHATLSTLRFKGQPEDITFTGDQPSVIKPSDVQMTCHGMAYDKTSGEFTIETAGLYFVQFRFATVTNYGILTPFFGSVPGKLSVFVNGKKSELEHMITANYASYTSEAFGTLELNEGDKLDVRYTGTLTPTNTVGLQEWIIVLRLL